MKWIDFLLVDLSTWRTYRTCVKRIKNQKGEKMQKENELNKNSMDYIPTWDEAKVPKWLQNKLSDIIDDENELKKLESQLDGYIEAYKRKHREQIRKKEIAKAEVKNRKVLAHWFATLPKDKIIALIEKTRLYADEVIDLRRDSVSAQWELNYVEKLRIRVKRNPITVESTTIDKMKRFPSYDPANDCLTGSPYSFYRMWAHCFKSEKRLSGHIRAM